MLFQRKLKRNAYWLLAGFGTVIVGVLLVLAYRSWYRSSCRLRDARVTMQVRHLFSTFKDFPEWPDDVYAQTTAEPLLSWRAILAFNTIPDPMILRMTEKWSSPNNAELARVGPLAGVAATAQSPPMVWAIVGPDTAFTKRELSTTKNNQPPRALLVTTAMGRGHWMQPGDLTISDLEHVASRNGMMSELVGGFSCGDEFHVLLSNGQASRNMSKGSEHVKEKGKGKSQRCQERVRNGKAFGF